MFFVFLPSLSLINKFNLKKFLSTKYIRVLLFLVENHDIKIDIIEYYPFPKTAALKSQ